MKKIIFIALVLSGIGSAFAQQIIEYGNPRYLYPTLRPLLSQDLHGRIIMSDVNSTTGKMATATLTPDCFTSVPHNDTIADSVYVTKTNTISSTPYSYSIMGFRSTVSPIIYIDCLKP